MTTWTEEDAQKAGNEGWLVAGGIERVDAMIEFIPEWEGGPIFAGDDEALTYVQTQIAAGDPLAVKAAAFLLSLGMDINDCPALTASVVDATEEPGM